MNNTESNTSAAGSGEGVTNKVRKAGAWVLRPSFSKDNWNPGKGSLDMLNYVKRSKKEIEPLKYEDICEAYAHTLDDNNMSDILRVKKRRNLFAIVLVLYILILTLFNLKPQMIFTYWVMDFILFIIPVISLFSATIIMDFFLEIARVRKSISFSKYLKIKVGFS
jgi:hypothetical protein